MIGFGYSNYGGEATLKWYLNGKKLTVDHGNITGLYLRVERVPIISNGYFSCFEVQSAYDKMIDDSFFTDTNMTNCRMYML